MKFKKGDRVIPISMPESVYPNGEIREEGYEHDSLNKEHMVVSDLGLDKDKTSEDYEEVIGYELSDGLWWYEENLISAQPLEPANPTPVTGKHKEVVQMGIIVSKRLVQVVVVDPEDSRNIPLDKAVILNTGQFMTDELNEEILQNLCLGEKLADHNMFREATLDVVKSEQIGHEVHLAPLKMRDLVKKVITIAEF